MELNFIDDVVAGLQVGDTCTLTGRVAHVRRQKRIGFVDIIDQSGSIQVIIKDDDSDLFERLSDIHEGSYIKVSGQFNTKDGNNEIKTKSVDIIADATLPLSPSPWKMDSLIPSRGRQVFDYTEFYLANPKRAAVLRAKSSFIKGLHRYFQGHRFELVDPPIITDKTLYGDHNSIGAVVHGEGVYLSQCATFELEPLALVFGKVYTISPAFRNEKAGSKRHLAEYTHAKAEVLLADVNDLMELSGYSILSGVENMINESQKELDLLEVEIDVEKLHPRNHEMIEYNDALKIVNNSGSTTEFGQELTAHDGDILTQHLGDRYVWVQFPPFASEGFPYKRNPRDRRLSMTCDLIAPHSAGEMVGVAEKISDPEELIENLIEKGMRDNIRRYWNYILLRLYGMPPHGGIGVAPERIIYGLLGLDHIRLTKPWPRYPDRKILPNPSDSLNPWRFVGIDRIIEKYGIK